MKKRALSAIFLIILPINAFSGSVNDTVALSEVRLLGEALQLVYAETTYLTTLENLNDFTTPSQITPYDYINHNGGALVIKPFFGDFEANRLDFLNRPFGLGWQGPYVNIQAIYTSPTSSYDPGTFLDPWGRPYLFYSPLGLLKPSTESVTLEFHGDQFSTYTVASLGADGVVSEDDHTFSLGIGISRLAISSMSIRNNTGTGLQASAAGLSTAPFVLHLRGYQFGTQQGTVALGGAPLTILNWSDREIDAALSSRPDLGSTVELTTSTNSTTSFAGIQDKTTPARAEGWEIYE